MGNLKILTAGFVVFSQTLAFSAEVDQYTRRDEYLSDVAPVINAKANESLLRAIDLANIKSKSCDEGVLYKEMRKYFSNHLKGELIKDILKDPAVEKRTVSLYDSVYQDWSVWDGIGMGFTIFAKKESRWPESFA